MTENPAASRCWERKSNILGVISYNEGFFDGPLKADPSSMDVGLVSVSDL
jgi:hypothetical protein